MAAAQPSIFPHETLDLIFSFCDVPTLAVVGRVSLACLELSAPRLYEHIELRDKQSAELLLCESKPSSDRVGAQLSLTRVRTLAILYNPGGEIVSYDRLPVQTSRRLELDALKLVLEVPTYNPFKRAKTQIAFKSLTEHQGSVPPNAHLIPLNALATLLNPQTFLSEINSLDPTAVSTAVFAGQPTDDAEWNRLKLVLRSGTADATSVRSRPDRVTLPFEDVWCGVDLVQVYRPERSPEVRNAMSFVLAGTPVVGLRGHAKMLRVWVESQADEQKVVAEVNQLNRTEAEVRKAVTIETKPDGCDGWWEDQKAKKKPHELVTQ